MRVGGVSTDDKVLIVAEIGNNHEGKLAVAEELVRRAAETGVDAVKFQTFQTRLFTSNADPARFARLSSFELSYTEFSALECLARSLGLLFISTPLDLESARFLEPLVDAYKIASGDNDFFPLIANVCASGKPVIISTGLSELADVKRTHRFADEELRRAHNAASELAFLHCVSSYPVPPAEANLAAIPLLAEELGCTVGYSDHTTGPGACLLAVALGARIIEKHFTLDKHFSDFRDHQLSADPSEMKRIVGGIREVERRLGASERPRPLAIEEDAELRRLIAELPNAEELLGKREKVLQPSERATLAVARRSIVAGRDLEADHVLTDGDLLWLRPAGGLAPGNEQALLGRRTTRSLGFGERITLADVT